MLKAIGRVIFWRYQRGSWQYDILCGLILLFIFLTPREVFDGRAFSEEPESPGFTEKQVMQREPPEVLPARVATGS